MRTQLGTWLLSAVATMALAQASHAVVHVNVARLGTATQSTEGFGGAASRAIDGGIDGNYGNNSVTHTNGDAFGFWQVDLGETRELQSVTLHNRLDCCGARLSNFRVSVLDEFNSEVFGENFTGPVAQGGSQTFALPGGVAGRTVKVQYTGVNFQGDSFLSLAEAQVIGSAELQNFTNVAQRLGTATQSSVDFGGAAHRAIDGNTNGNYGAGSTTHTFDAPNSFWIVDLHDELALESVRLFNRADCCGNRLGNFRLSVLDKAMNEVFGQDVAGAVGQGGNMNIALPFGVKGEFVKVQLNGVNTEGNGILSLAEVQVMGGERFNVARNPLAEASQSTTGFGGDAARAIDGNTDGNYGNGSVSHTNGDANGFWQVDLNADFNIGEIILHNRADCCGNRLSNFRVSILDDGLEVFGENFFELSGNVDQGGLLRVLVPNIDGDLVRVQYLGLNRDNNFFLSLAEVQVFQGAGVPEPASALLGLLGVAALARRRRAAA